jgi:hypothetical protein
MAVTQSTTCDHCGCENTRTSVKENTLRFSNRSNWCIACKNRLDWRPRIKCINCQEINRLGKYQFERGWCRRCKKPIQWSVNPKNYIPNHITKFEQIICAVASVLLFFLSAKGIYLNKAYFLYKKGYSVFTVEFIGFEMIVPILCMLFAATSCLATIADHYDKRFNEYIYQRFIKWSMYIALILYVLSLFFGHKVA